MKSRFHFLRIFLIVVTISSCTYQSQTKESTKEPVSTDERNVSDHASRAPQEQAEYQVRIFRNPRFKNRVEGSLYMSLVLPSYVSSADRQVWTNILKSFARQIVTFTSVRVDLTLPQNLGDLDMIAPWMYLRADSGFILTEPEIYKLGAFLGSGGFVLAESCGSEEALDSFRLAFSEAFGYRVKSHRVDPEIFHCCFDISRGTYESLELRGIYLPNGLLVAVINLSENDIGMSILRGASIEKRKLAVNFVLYPFVRAAMQGDRRR